jgi:RNA polymerase sigma-70 factor (ECF subfamily)
MKNLLKFSPQNDSPAANFRIYQQNTLSPMGALPGSMDDTDDQLMGRVAGKDAAALEVLYDRYAPVVMGVAMRILSERSMAEDIVQETFLRVWRSATSFDRLRGSFLGWLVRIARNLAIDQYRHFAGRSPTDRSQPEAELPEDPVDPDADVAENAWTAIRRQQVKAALGTLPSAQRQVLELAFFKGLTRQEIAEATGEALGTVHTRARLGLQKLRDELISRHVEI